MRKSMSAHFISMILSLTFLTAVGGMYHVASFASEKKPVNESALQVMGLSQETIMTGADRKGDVSRCKGRVPEGGDLKPIGLTAHDLNTMGADCVVADFDGNGYLDFVLFDSQSRNYLVIYFFGKSVLRTQIIKGIARPLVIFDLKDPDRKDYPKFLKSPGLISPGANGDVGYIFFMNPKSGLLEKAPYVYHEDSGVD